MEERGHALLSEAKALRAAGGRDKEVRQKLFESAHQGNAEAVFWLAHALGVGELCIRPNYVLFLDGMAKAAGLGFAPAAAVAGFETAANYPAMDDFCWGVWDSRTLKFPRLTPMSIQFFEQAEQAPGGHMIASYRLGAYYEHVGYRALARQHYERAASLGCARSQFALSNFPELSEEARLHHLQRAAAQKHVPALRQLGEWYISGEHMMKRDWAKAARCFWRARMRQTIAARIRTICTLSPASMREHMRELYVYGMLLCNHPEERRYYSRVALQRVRDVVERSNRAARQKAHFAWRLRRDPFLLGVHPAV